MALLGYLITFRTYGSWLPGDERGFVDHARSGRGAFQREAHSGLFRAMTPLRKHEAIVFDAECRSLIEDAIRDACEYRAWTIRAMSIRSNHFHFVISAPDTPENVMKILKARATRRLREVRPQLSSVNLWSRHGSTRYLNDEAGFRAACRYVNEGQGDEIPV